MAHRTFASGPLPRHESPPASGLAHVNVDPLQRLASVLGGGLLLVSGLTRRSAAGYFAAGLGGALVFRGATGHCPVFGQLGIDTAESAPEPIEIHTSVTINRTPQETYAFWRQLDRLPRFMTHLRRVEEIDARRSRWEADSIGPLPSLSWEAEIVEDLPGEVLAWRSIPGGDLDNSGYVRFAEAPAGGTEVHVTITYRPPAAEIGAAVGRWLSPALTQVIREDVRRFKHLLESGEIPTTDGQPHGRH